MFGHKARRRTAPAWRQCARGPASAHASKPSATRRSCRVRKCQLPKHTTARRSGDKTRRRRGKRLRTFSTFRDLRHTPEVGNSRQSRNPGFSGTTKPERLHTALAEGAARNACGRRAPTVAWTATRLEAQPPGRQRRGSGTAPKNNNRTPLQVPGTKSERGRPFHSPSCGTQWVSACPGGVHCRGAPPQNAHNLAYKTLPQIPTS